MWCPCRVAGSGLGMNPVRTLARPMLASIFISGGVDALRTADRLAPVAKPVTDKVVDAAQPVVDRAAEAAAPAVEAAAEKVVELADAAGEALPDAAQPAVDKAADAARPLAGDTLLPGSEPQAPRVELPRDPELLTQVNGAVMVGAGALLAIGKLPRLSAVALAATIVPTTLAAHRFWEMDDPEERSANQIHFFKNLALLGGLALASQDTAGNPSLAWRASHKAADVRDSVAAALPG